MALAHGLFGIAVLVFIAWLLSFDRRRFPWQTVLVGLGLQWVLALFVLRTAAGEAIFDGMGRIVNVVLRGADAGARFVFGPLAGSNPDVPWPAIAGIKIMTTIIVVATLSAVGYHYGILQRVVAGMAWIMRRAMRTTGPESLSCAANVFLGQTEAPLLVRPYISAMSLSELMALMTGGFATIAAGVMAVYISMLGGGDAAKAVSVARHLLTASLMSAPAALVMAKIMAPPPRTEPGAAMSHVEVPRETSGLLDAATHGATQGMTLAINVLAMLVAFIALIAILDAGLTALGRLSFIAPAVQALGLERLDLNGILGLLFSPVARVLGVERGDCRKFGSILGTAMATNEMVAYGTLTDMFKAQAMSPRSLTMAIYSICGFANFSSIGIQIGGIGAMAPDRRADLVRLAPRAMLGGAMASWCTGCIAGVLI